MDLNHPKNSVEESKRLSNKKRDETYRRHGELNKASISQMLFVWILCLSLIGLCMRFADSTTCSTSSESMNTLRTVQRKFSGFTTNDAYDLVVGTVSSDAYYFEYVNTATVIATAIQRKTLSGTEKWLKAYSGKITMNGAAIDQLENNIYYLISTSSYAQIVNLKTSDGSLYQTMQNTQLKIPQLYSKVRLNPDETYLYFQAQSIANSLGEICKIKINVNNYFECAELIGQTLPAAISLIQNDAYFTASKSTSNINFSMIRIDMSSGAYKWVTEIGCTSSPCTLSYSASLLNDDQSIVYSLSSPNSAAVFIQLNATDGTSINSKYKFSTSCSEGDALHKYKTKVYIIMFCGSSSLIVVHDISNLSFAYYQINGSGMKSHSFKTDSLENRMLVCGHGVGGALSFSIITYEETLDIHFNITSSTSTFTVQTSAQYPVSYSAVSTMTISSYTVTNSTLTSYVTSEVSNSDQFLSDISYWLRDYYAYNLVHNTYIEKEINLTCSSSGSSTVTHTKIANGANAIPDWAIIDSANSKLLLTTPKLTTETNFTFGISSYVTIDSKAYTRNVYLQVIVPADPTSSTSTTTSSTTKTASTSSSVPVPVSTLAVLSVAFGFFAFSSFLSLSTSIGFWLVIGQYQLLTILPLIGSYMPTSIIEYCEGLKYVLFTENIADPISLNGIKYAYSYMDKVQSNGYLYEIGFESQSTFVNAFSLVVVLLCLALINVVVLVLYCTMKPFKEVERSKCRKLVRFLFRLFTFDLYIRIGLCCFLFVVLSSMLETYNGFTGALSIVLSSLILVVTVVFLLFCLFEWYAVRTDPAKRDKSLFRQLFKDENEKSSSGLFILFEQLRVVVLLVCVSYLDCIPFAARCAIFTFCQTVYCVAIIWMRPFGKIVMNLMKIFNEVTYFILSFALNFLQVKSSWNEVIEKTYLYLMMSICVQVVILSLIDLIITIVQKYKKPITRVRSLVNLHKLPVDSLVVESQIPPMIIGDTKVFKMNEFDPYYNPQRTFREK